MIIGECTEKGKGIFLRGDYNDLRNAHNVLHYLSSTSKTLQEGTAPGDWALGLAYDLRKAYEGQREQSEVGSDCGAAYEKATYLGVKILWPVFLTQLSMFRQGAAFCPTTREVHAVLYSLEAIADFALRDRNADVADTVMGWYDTANFHSNYYIQYLVDISYKFQYLETPLNELCDLLNSTFWGSTEYKNFVEKIDSAARKNKCSPRNIELKYVDKKFEW